AKPGWLVPSKSTEPAIAGSGVVGSMVWTPTPGMAKSIVSARPASQFVSKMAWRNEPGPLSAVESTTTTPAVISSCVWSGDAPKDWAPKVRRVVRPRYPSAGLKTIPWSASSIAASGPLYDNDPVPSPKPVRPAVLDSVSDPSDADSVRFHNVLIGPASA